MDKEYQLINVRFKGNSQKYVFAAEKTISKKDIVYCVTDRGSSPGIVTDIDVNVGVLLKNHHIGYSLKEAEFICKSTHDLKSSRNMAIKAIFKAHDVAMYELIKMCDEETCNTEIEDTDLPF